MAERAYNPCDDPHFVGLLKQLAAEEKIEVSRFTRDELFLQAPNCCYVLKRASSGAWSLTDASWPEFPVSKDAAAKLADELTFVSECLFRLA